VKLNQLTIKELHKKLKAKEISPFEVATDVLSHVDGVEEDIHAYVSLNNNLLDDSKNVTEIDNPLAGIPIAVKDNMCTKGVLTTCSSEILYNHLPVYDATVVNKLKRQNYVMVGKTNLDEFAMGSSTENSAFKITRNPWNLETVPGGSSGGSAAAVAADMCIAALGSDTGGSIRQPASLCGVVGMKPTYGLVSRYGLVAFASSLDQIGPITKDVTDCAISLQAIAGHDNKDSTSLGVNTPDYRQALSAEVKGLKIGLIEELMVEGIQKEVKELTDHGLNLLEKMGASVGPVSLPHLEYALSAYYIIAPAEASSNLARFDSVRYGLREEAEDMVDTYKKTRAKGFGDEVKRRIMLGTYALSAGYYDAYYGQAQKVRTLIIDDFKKAFEKYDVLVSPTSPTTAFKIGEKATDPLQMYLSDICTIPVNLAGLPAISIPCGVDDKGLPVGFQIIGKHLDESTVIKAAYALEQEIGFKEKPKLLKRD